MKKQSRKKPKSIWVARFWIGVAMISYTLFLILYAVIARGKNRVDAEIESVLVAEKIEAEKLQQETEKEDIDLVRSTREVLQEEESSVQKETETRPDYSKLVIGTRYVLGDGVRVRTAPTTDSEIHAVLEQYAEVQITDENSEWTEIYMDDYIYYILGSYVGTSEDVENKKYRESLEYKRKQSAYYNAFENMSGEDYELMARILALEAQDEPWKGKLAVIETIMNRVISKDPYFPDTISGVLLQRGQFETVNYLSRPYNTPKSDDYAAIDYVRDNGPTAIRSFLDDAGMTSINSLDYVFFATYRANGRDFVKYGGHYFSRGTNKKYWRPRI